MLIHLKLYFCHPNAKVAQLVEHDLAKVGVASSNLVFRSNPFSNLKGFFIWFLFNVPVYLYSAHKPIIMKTDLYTKIILTIIAAALTLNLVKSSITPAMADTKKYVALPVNPDGSINVNINKADGPLDVNLKTVETNAFYYVRPISVKVSQ